MKNLKIHFALFIVTIVLLTACSRPISYKADKFYNQLAYMEAIEKYEALLEKHPENVEMITKLANSYRLTNQNEKAEEWYARAIQFPNSHPSNKFYYGQMLMKNGKHAEAEPQMQSYNSIQPEDERGKKFSEALGNLTTFYVDSAIYEIDTLDINSQEADFAPAFFNKGLVFASSRIEKYPMSRNHAWNNKPFTAIYYSPRSHKILSSAKPFHKQIQSKYHDGAVTFNQDETDMYFTRNNIVNGNVRKSEDDKVKLKIFRSVRSDNIWSKPKEFAYNSDNYHCAHPTLSEDGTKLYFSSNMPGSMGGMDIFVCEKSAQGWTAPKNLGPEINTRGNEIFPFISSKNMLYFASDGHQGLGGLDLFYSSSKNNEWNPVSNVGYPINTEHDDFAMVFNTENTEGYFSSNRPGGAGDDDIYGFKKMAMKVKLLAVDEKTNEHLYEVDFNVAPQNLKSYQKNSGIDGFASIYGSSESIIDITADKTGYKTAQKNIALSDYKENGEEIIIEVPMTKLLLVTIEGLAYSHFANAPLIDTPIKIRNSTTGEESIITTDYKGNYEYQAVPEMDYEIKLINKDCYNTIRHQSTMNVIDDKTFRVDLGLVCGDLWKLEDLYYDLDKYYIRPDAALVLDKLANIMHEVPGLKIELRSHTDSRASRIYNDKLSSNRAKSAVEYLESKGIKRNRLKARGYGERQLANKCRDGIKCSENLHQNNRRTEVKILSVR